MFHRRRLSRSITTFSRRSGTTAAICRFGSRTYRHTGNKKAASAVFPNKKD